MKNGLKTKKRISLMTGGIIFFTFLLIGQWIKISISFIKIYVSEGFEKVEPILLTLGFMTYYLITIGIIVGLGFLELRKIKQEERGE